MATNPTTYSTTQAIRDASGFTANEYVLDPSIETQRKRAFAQINSVIGMRYAIPSLTDTNFLNSPAHQYLESIENILGSALLLIEEYGRQALDTDKDGYKKKKEAESMLNDIREGKVVLFGVDGNILEGVTSTNKPRGTIRGYVHDQDRRFGVDDTF